MGHNCVLQTNCGLSFSFLCCALQPIWMISLKFVSTATFDSSTYTATNRVLRFLCLFRKALHSFFLDIESALESFSCHGFLVLIHWHLQKFRNVIFGVIVWSGVAPRPFAQKLFWIWGSAAWNLNFYSSIQGSYKDWPNWNIFDCGTIF